MSVGVVQRGQLRSMTACGWRWTLNPHEGQLRETI
jgi:hypothetical protein